MPGPIHYTSKRNEFINYLEMQQCFLDFLSFSCVLQNVFYDFSAAFSFTLGVGQHYTRSMWPAIIPELSPKSQNQGIYANHRAGCSKLKFVKHLFLSRIIQYSTWAGGVNAKPGIFCTKNVLQVFGFYSSRSWNLQPSRDGWITTPSRLMVNGDGP